MKNLHQKVVEEYFTQVKSIEKVTENKRFFAYAEQLVAKHPERIQEFIQLALKRGEEEERILNVTRLMAIYNYKHMNKKEGYFRSQDIGQAYVPLEAIVLAGGGGARLSLIGADSEKPALEIPCPDDSQGGYFPKALIDFTVEQAVSAGYGSFIFCGNDLRPWIQERYSCAPFQRKFVSVPTPSKKEAMRAALELINPKTIAVLRSPADIYRRENLIAQATALHFSSSDPEDTMTIIGRRVSVGESGLSTTAYEVDGNSILSVQRASPNEELQGKRFLGIKLGTIIGRKKLALFGEYADPETNETYNKIAQLAPGSLLFFEGKESKTRNIDDPFDLDATLRTIFHYSPERFLEEVYSFFL